MKKKNLYNITIQRRADKDETYIVTTICDGRYVCTHRTDTARDIIIFLEATIKVNMI